MAEHYVVEISTTYGMETDADTVHDAIEGAAAYFLKSYPGQVIEDVRVWRMRGELVEVVKDWSDYESSKAGEGYDHGDKLYSS